LVVAGTTAVALPGPGAPRAAAQAGAPDEVDYAPPVDAQITDPFRPPPQPWLPGNRGIEYATAPGTPVAAAGRGRVTFAGAVAGSLHVTIAHPDGVRTSYSYLATVAVAAGTEVQRGHVVGTTGARLHVGARRGDTYIDPASLWGRRGPPWVRLAPLDGGVPEPARRRVGGVRGVAN
jgi:murein DD-endopeptidase MepM/ murein hydrolase activator NlpD